MTSEEAFLILVNFVQVDTAIKDVIKIWGVGCIMNWLNAFATCILHKTVLVI